MLARKALAGTAGAPKLYVEDVYSTYLYSGNQSTQTITNNIDLSTEGGLVWGKSRDAIGSHFLVDTVRGINGRLTSNSTNSDAGASDITSFNTNGFSLGYVGADLNTNGTRVAWTFRKAKKFFDVVTYTGNGSSNRQISHNLGSVPGCVIVKRTDSTGNWPVYHRMLNGGTNPEQYAIYLNLTNDGTGGGRWANTAPTSTQFSVNNDDSVNANGGTYVAYLFAHDAGGFGDAGSDSIIKCGSFTTASATLSVTLGWEPQWILFKRSDSTGDWQLYDNMRGMVSGGSQRLYPNLSNAEDVGAGIQLTATGFEVNTTYNATFVYIAIRRGPMKTPTSGTSVYNAVTRTGTGAAATITGVGFAPDLYIGSMRTSSVYPAFVDRLRGNTKGLASTATAAETTSSSTGDVTAFGMDGISLGTNDQLNFNINTVTAINWFFRRAPGFFDVVCYTGTGSGSQTISHNLGAVPELIITRARNSSDDWYTYSATTGNTKTLFLNYTNAESSASSNYWNNTSPTSTQFTAGPYRNGSANYIAYLFASVSGVSKVGSFTGNGSSVTVTTDFQPRFILVKRTDSTGNWIVSDSARGLVASSDPYLLLNSTAAEDTDEDWVDVSSTGFTVNQTTAANANVNTGTYIYLAVS